MSEEDTDPTDVPQKDEPPIVSIVRLLLHHLTAISAFVTAMVSLFLACENRNVSKEHKVLIEANTEKVGEIEDKAHEAKAKADVAATKVEVIEQKADVAKVKADTLEKKVDVIEKKVGK